jgi:hypothetical protein
MTTETKAVKPIELMKGLEIQFANDGTWLFFKDSRGSSSALRLENLSDSSGRIVNTTIQKWSEDRRAEPNQQEKIARLDLPEIRRRFRAAYDEALREGCDAPGAVDCAMDEISEFFD